MHRDMGNETLKDLIWEDEVEDDERVVGMLDFQKYVFGFIELGVVKCAVELGLPDIIGSHGRPMTLLELSKSLSCATSPLDRIMRFLAHKRIFKERKAINGSKGYAETPISRLMRSGENSMTAPILLQNSSAMLAPWHNLSAYTLGRVDSPFEATHGMDLWSYIAKNPTFGKHFSESVSLLAKSTVSAIIDNCKEVFYGLESVVDVGGGNGTALGMLVKAFPRIRGINFDLPHVVSVAHNYEGVEHVGGNMFEFVPKADATFLLRVLHDWDDNECINILKKCKEAIPNDNKGKVIIVEAIIEEDRKKEEKIMDMIFELDMEMLAYTNGKERTLKEWIYLLGEAGFTRHNVKSSNATFASIIEAFP